MDNVSIVFFSENKLLNTLDNKLAVFVIPLSQRFPLIDAALVTARWSVLSLYKLTCTLFLPIRKIQAWTSTDVRVSSYPLCFAVWHRYVLSSEIQIALRFKLYIFLELIDFYVWWGCKGEKGVCTYV